MTKKKYVIFGMITVCVVIGVAFLIHYLSIDRREYALVLMGDREITLEVFDEYEDAGAWVSVDGEIDKTIEVLVESDVDTSILGKYEVNYTVVGKEDLVDGRMITVIDTQSPVLTLKGSNVTLLVDEQYEEPGYEVVDNYDQDLVDKVEVSGAVDTKTAGEYVLTYTVMDSSGNSHQAERTITIKKPLVVKHVAPIQDKGDVVKPVVAKQGTVLKEITDLKFSGDGFKLVGSHETAIDVVNLINKDTGEVVSYPTSLSENKYSVNIGVGGLANGTYRIAGQALNNESLVFKLDELLRLGRGRVGNKLITFSYPNNTVELTVSDFAYQYDIAINVGHGGPDPGAINKYIQEKAMNLEVSLYEKARYEAHGLSVYIDRTSDTYSTMVGPTDWKNLTRSAFNFGSYAAVSRVAYSNHHNSSASASSGWEIIVSSTISKDESAVERGIGSAWNQIIPNMKSRTRFYTRDYDSERIFSKANGEVYNFTTYYAIVRIPLENYNAKTVLFEPIFISNDGDFSWYWQQGNWKSVSEAKIKAYVQSLGVEYIAPGSTPPEEEAPAEEAPAEEAPDQQAGDSTPEVNDSETQNPQDDAGS